MFDKIPFHRILALLTLFCVSLTACTPAPALTATATMPVETPKPSATATEAPTATATATPDPNMPPGEGVYKKDGTYYKPDVNEFGEKVTLEWVPGSAHGENLKGWYSPHGGFPAIRHGKFNDYEFIKDYMPIELQMSEGVEGLKIQYQYDVNQVTTPKLGILIQSNFGRRYVQEGHGRNDFYFDLTSGNTISIPFDSTDGKTYEFNPNTENGVIVRWVDLDTALKDKRFLKEGVGESNTQIYVFTTGDGMGGIMTYIASNKPFSSMTPKEIRQAMLFSLISVSIGKDQTHGPKSVYYTKLGKLGTDLLFFSEEAAKGDPPVVDFVLHPAHLPTPTATP